MCAGTSQNLTMSSFLSFSLQTPATQAIADSLVDDFVVTESASAVEVAIAESAAVEPVRTTQGMNHTHRLPFATLNKQAL